MTRLLPIDGKKLKMSLVDKGVTGKEVSRCIGLADNYISQCIHFNRISRTAALAVEHVFGIKMDSYIEF